MAVQEGEVKREKVAVVMVAHPEQILLEQVLLFIIQQEVRELVMVIGTQMLTPVVVELLLIIADMVVLGMQLVPERVEVELL